MSILKLEKKTINKTKENYNLAFKGNNNNQKVYKINIYRIIKRFLTEDSNNFRSI